MKTFFVLTACLLSTAAFAADPAPKPAAPTCGKTTEDCQKQVDDLTNRLAQATLSYQAERQQRINALTNAGDQVTQAYVTQQTTAAAAAPKK